MLLTLTLGGVRAEIGTVAAALRSLSVDGATLTETTHGDGVPPFSSGIVLAPWPNRVADARWSLDGEPQQLDITEPEHGGALHGLLRFTDYQIDAQRDDLAELSAFIPPQHGWPFALQTGVRYELRPDGIRVTHLVHNRAARRAPWAVGSHPFLRVGDAAVEDLVVQAVAGSRYPVDDRLNPTGPAVAPDDGTDLRVPRRVGDLRLDTAYGELAHRDPVDGHGDVAWLEAPDGARTTLWQDLSWGYLQVFTTPRFPRPDGPGTAIAIEPMTAPPDALNSGEGLIWLDPDERWSGSWGLRYTGRVSR